MYLMPCVSVITDYDGNGDTVASRLTIKTRHNWILMKIKTNVSTSALYKLQKMQNTQLAYWTTVWAIDLIQNKTNS